ncbi:MAG: hypothetical protein F8N15_04925 [Methanobacterium sp.]|nr:hypothetical protein [Methanobacterium sp.]
MTNKGEWFSHIKGDGVCDSKFERSIFNQLKAAGLHVVREPRPIHYGPLRYLPDFGRKTRAGKDVFIEAKGWLNTKAAAKMRSVKF